jgi:RimJ/RimL family protein N-acetyltransferase
MAAPFLPCTTSLLTLRPFRADDAAPFAAYRSDPDVARYQGWSAPYPLADAARFVAEMATVDGPRADEWVQIAVEHAGMLIGDVAVGLDETASIATIGYTIAPAHQGHGYAVEAVGALVDRLLARTGVHRVEASLDPRNIASARVVEAVGFEFEGVARATERDGDGWADDARYGLLAADRAARLARPQGPPADVRLVEITPATAPAVLALRTHRSQERSVATVAASFADALVPPLEDGAPVVPWMRAIEADGDLVGFVMTTEVTEHHPEPYLWRLLVDRRHQRRGVGDRAMALLVERWRAAGCASVAVSWVPGPGSPAPFYLGRGFVPTGEVDDGEVVARRAL